MVHNFIHSARILSDACNSFRRYCVEGLQANRARIEELSERSLMNVTALAPTIGYDKAAKIAHRAQADETTLKEATLALGYLSAEEFDAIVQPARMAHPHD